MTTTELLARVKATRDQKGRMYDGELQTLLADVAAHLEGERDARPTEAETRAATANTAKHTPGEWEIDRTGKYYKPCIRRNGVIIAYLPDNAADLAVAADSMRRQDDANAHLITAAPDLLDAVYAVRDAFADGSLRFIKKRQADSEPYHPASVKMCAAIAKAEGRDN